MAVGDKERGNMEMEFIEEFQKPSVKYRIKPFWFWNGDMCEQEIEHQIKEMASKGLGGAFICPRQGMTVPYLSEEWFAKVKFACEKAIEYGIENWLYDEYPYPSGMSGGEVLLKHPEAEHMMLLPFVKECKGECRVSYDLGWGEILYAKAVEVLEDGQINRSSCIDLVDYIGNLQQEEIYQQTGLTAYNHKRFFSYGPTHLLNIVLPKGHWRIEVFSQERMGDFKYYGGFFDPCNKNAVRTFLDTTHESYKKHLGKEFGKTIFGMFSDEVGLLSRIPWTKEGIKAFEERNGYSLLEVLPALVDETYEDASKIRYEFFQTLHELFVDSYHKQVAQWCRDNDLMYATEVPSMRMSTQRYSDVIGGDTAHEKLGKPLEWIYDRYLHNYRTNSKSVTSLAKQLDKKFAMIESFHSVGWTMTLQDAKWMVDLMGANGINLFNFHAFYYTIDGITKHDAPPSQFLQNPYWEHYGALADYVGRMSVFNSFTSAVTKIAVLDPIPSLWSKLANPFSGFEYAGESKEEEKICNQIREDWSYVCKTILFHQLDYDHLDAEILDMAVVKDGKIVIGRCAYSILVLPPTICIEAKATRKIQEFILAGGQVIALGSLPNEVIDEDTQPAHTYELMFKQEGTHFIKSKGLLKESNVEHEFIEILKNLLMSEVEVVLPKDCEKQFVTSIRKTKDGQLMIFISNQGSNSGMAAVKIKLPHIKGGIRWSLEDGSQTPLDFLDDELLLPFVAYESYCILLTEQEQTVVKKSVSTIVIDTKDSMEVQIKGHNIFRFEHFLLSLDEKNWGKIDVKTCMEQMSQTNLLRPEYIRFEGMFGTPKKMSLAYPLQLFYRSTFTVTSIAKQINILFDAKTIRGEYKIKLNGKAVDLQNLHPVFVNDQNNQMCDITSYLVLGENELYIEVLASRDSDGITDVIYLAGDFGVVKLGEEFVIDIPCTKTNLSNTYIEGFPFYSGRFTFDQTIMIKEEELSEEMHLQFDFMNTRYDCLEVLVNGVSLGVRGFTPYVWKNLAKNLKVGENKITLHLINTLANMLDGTYFDYDSHKIVSID